MKADYESLLDRLREAGCPHKLYPARIRALEVVTGEPLLAQVEETIVRRVAIAAGNVGWKEQFQSDLETFGLLEAIVYFHSYPPLPDDFVEDACRLYERLAALYMEHHDEIVETDDPRVRVQLERLQRYGDSSQHIVPGVRRTPRPVSAGIAAAASPAKVADYGRRLPVHPDMLAMGMVGKMESFPDELVEQIAARFTFDGFPGIQAAFFDAADVLDEHGIDVYGAEGQYVIAKLVGYLEIEMFGDFERWIPCAQCGEEFLVSVSLEGVDDSLQFGGWRCDDCRSGAVPAG